MSLVFTGAVPDALDVRVAFDIDTAGAAADGAAAGGAVCCEEQMPHLRG